MCGIWGYIGKNVSTKTALKSFNKIGHRGPDSSVFKKVDSLGYIGFHRLGIIDKSINSNQPFINKIFRDGQNKITYSMCNGEIYNYRNILPSAKSDCETIPFLHSKGYCIPHYLNGEYAYSVLDVIGDKFELELGTDHLGIRPLFYAINSNGVGWSSEVKGLLDIFPGEYIKRFQPGHHLKISTNNLYSPSVQYEDIYNNIQSLTDPEEALSLIERTLSDCVDKMLMSDAPIGCLLSGGLDSSIISALVSLRFKQKGKVLQTFSVGMPGSTDEYYAQLTANHIGSNHTHFKFSEQEFLNAIPKVIESIESYDTTTVRASVGQYLVSKMIRKTTDIKVLLVGDGSDELCSGYLYAHNAPSSASLHKDNMRLLKNIHLFDVLRSDRGISAHGLESRVPFLHKDFLRLYLSIDSKLRHPSYPENPIEKWLLRKAFEKYLPVEVVWRRKEAFSDGVSGVNNSWFGIIKNSIENNNYDDNLLDLPNPPLSTEAMYYRTIFRRLYPDCDHLIPYYWLPKWSGGTTEPSARTLKHY